MIQRIQTLYYGIAAICLIAITLGINVFSFHISAESAASLNLDFSSYGVSGSADFMQVDLNQPQYEEFREIAKLENGVVKYDYKVLVYFPFYAITILLSLMVIAAVFMFKKMPLQVRTGRAGFFFTLLLFIFVIVMYYVGGSQFTEVLPNSEATKSLGLGFYLLSIAIAFLFLGNLGVRRDIKLVKSLDRLR